uniref:(northern house mosquito) hypothetical protein n=1 Tax=Culex pipiens TaxID=7175 RepID=A0A8D8D209_CULPI
MGLAKLGFGSCSFLESVLPLTSTTSSPSQSSSPLPAVVTGFWTVGLLASSRLLPRRCPVTAGQLPWSSIGAILKFQTRSVTDTRTPKDPFFYALCVCVICVYFYNDLTARALTWKLSRRWRSPSNSRWKSSGSGRRRSAKVSHFIDTFFIFLGLVCFLLYSLPLITTTVFVLTLRFLCLFHYRTPPAIPSSVCSLFVVFSCFSRAFHNGQCFSITWES